MRKFFCILAAAVMLACCAAAAADDIPQPEGGKKFVSNWAMQDMLVTIDYEAEGYRVMLRAEDPEALEGTEWFYSCYYSEERDALVSVSSEKCAYVVSEEDPEDRRYGIPAYEGLDGEGENTVFTIAENGRLNWEEAHENCGQDLEFVNIGAFAGVWKNESEGTVYADISWRAHDGTGSYTVWVQSYTDDGDAYAVYELDGVYNAGTGKLECRGTAALFAVNAEGSYELSEEKDAEVFFSITENGMLLFEADGIELEPDYDYHG